MFWFSPVTLSYKFVNLWNSARRFVTLPRPINPHLLSGFMSSVAVLLGKFTALLSPSLASFLEQSPCSFLRPAMKWECYDCLEGKQSQLQYHWTLCPQSYVPILQTNWILSYSEKRLSSQFTNMWLALTTRFVPAQATRIICHGKNEMSSKNHDLLLAPRYRLASVSLEEQSWIHSLPWIYVITLADFEGLRQQEQPRLASFASSLRLLCVCSRLEAPSRCYLCSTHSTFCAEECWASRTTCCRSALGLLLLKWKRQTGSYW